MRNNIFKNLLIWVIIGAGLLMIFNKFNDSSEAKSNIHYSVFITQLENNQIKSATLQGKSSQVDVIKGEMVDGTKFTTYAPFDKDLINDLVKHNVDFQMKPQDDSLLMNIFISWFPMLLLIFISLQDHV